MVPLMPKPNPPFMSGIPELVILRLLSEREMYGYELVKTIRLLSNEELSLAEGVVYPVLHSLEAERALKSRRRLVAGRNRVYYRTTAAGRRRLNTLSHEWQRISSGVADLFTRAGSTT